MNSFGSEEEGENENIFVQALPVADIRDQNLNEPPKTGEEYLSRVRLEASKCPNVVVAKLDEKKIKPLKQKLIPDVDNNTETRKEFLASIDWQREKSLDFAGLRLNVDKKRSGFKKSSSEFNMPKLGKKNDWFKFCFGAKPAVSSDNSSEGGEDSFEEPKDPVLSLLYSMDQSTIVDLFDFHVEWFEKYGYSDTASKWIFSLMSFLEKPLLPETYSSLRNLARTCIRLRSTLKNPNDASLATLNLFIALVGTYFEQTDLLDS